MRRTAIRELFESYKKEDTGLSGRQVTVCGWARTVRASNAIGFIELNDGSYFTSLQVVFENSKLENYSDIAALNVGSAVCVEGEIIVTPNMKQPFELHAAKIDVEAASKDKALARIPQNDCPSSPAHEHVLRSVPHPQRRGIFHP